MIWIKSSISVLLIIFVIGFTSGFLTSQYFQVNINFPQIIFSIITWFGSGVGILGLFNKWFEDKKIPRLGYGEVYRHGNRYFLAVKMIGGEGMAEGCIGNLDISQTEIENTASVWEHNLVRHYDIGPPTGLLLFGINKKSNSITFPSAHALVESGCVMNERPYADFANREIKVNIYAKKGQTPPKPYIKKIRDIVNVNPIL